MMGTHEMSLKIVRSGPKLVLSAASIVITPISDATGIMDAPGMPVTVIWSAEALMRALAARNRTLEWLFVSSFVLAAPSR